ncbi:hypothetical protein GQ55_9G598900 [Panicum hallii var. hallii]|uniref:LisH domain-containing protein n=1 Tax=Panicum hallii var. hallii TaxID=1504633 RepID=A0A2T7CHB7_9POAL|nr:hypothetical protein GQ55_9G598900 [Panicum hallii var. hallii]
MCFGMNWLKPNAGGLHTWAIATHTRVDEETEEQGRGRQSRNPPAVTGNGMGQPSAVALLHLRRLDRFLKHRGLHRTADTLERESLVHFDAAHLQKLVKDGRWSAAWYYLRRFSPLWEPEGEGTNQQYTSLLHSLSDDSMLAFLACRGDEGGRAASLMFPGPSSRALPSDDAFRNKFSETIKRHDLCHSMTSAQARASVDWENIKLKTLEKIEELLRLHPDLKCSLRMRSPQRVPTLSEIIPLGLRGPKRHQRNRVGRKPARELAHFLLHIQKRLPSSQDTDQSGDSGVSSDTLLESTLANEAKASDISLSAANTGIKRARSQDDCYTEISNHGPKACYKRPRRFGDVDMKQESDFSG